MSNITKIVDSHAHLGMDDFKNDLDEVVKQSKEAGIAWILVPATDLNSSLKVVQLCEKYDNIFGAVGVHPHDAEKISGDDIDQIASLLSHPKIKAVGEIGLDFYYSFSPKDVQERIFSMQLALAKVNNLPVVIHSREAVEEILAIVDACNPGYIKGVFHCFTGTLTELKAILKRGFYISAGGMVTFKNFKGLDVIKHIPLDRLLLETDAPYLTPFPFRGSRNEPKFLNYTVQELAKIYNKSVDEIAEHTTLNAEKLFSVGKAK